MRSKKQLTACMLLTAFVANTAFAADTSEPNVFNADTSHPDLAAAISAFEETCMPFVLHQTELTKQQNVQHRDRHMQSLGFSFLYLETFSRKVIVDEQEAQIIQDKWDAEKRRLEELNKTKNGHFTVFNGGSNTWGQPARIPTHFRTVTQPHGIYELQSDPRVTANIGWNYASQNHPGKSCSISLAKPAVSLTRLKSDFIDNDPDWIAKYKNFNVDPSMPREDIVNWSQCVRDGDDEFKFTVTKTDETLSIHVIRNDFYTPDVCINWLKVNPAKP